MRHNISEERQKELLAPYLRDGVLYTARELMEIGKAMSAEDQEVPEQSAEESANPTPDEHCQSDPMSDEKAECLDQDSEERVLEMWYIAKEEDKWLNEELGNLAFDRIEDKTEAAKAARKLADEAKNGSPQRKACAREIYNAESDIEELMWCVESSTPELEKEARRIVALFKNEMAGEAIWIFKIQATLEKILKILLPIAGLGHKKKKHKDALRLFREVDKRNKTTKKLRDVYESLVREEYPIARKNPKKCKWIPQDEALKISNSAVGGYDNLDSNEVKRLVDNLWHRHNRLKREYTSYINSETPAE